MALLERLEIASGVCHLSGGQSGAAVVRESAVIEAHTDAPFFSAAYQETDRAGTFTPELAARRRAPVTLGDSGIPLSSWMSARKG